MKTLKDVADKLSTAIVHDMTFEASSHSDAPYKHFANKYPHISAVFADLSRASEKAAADAIAADTSEFPMINPNLDEAFEAISDHCKMQHSMDNDTAYSHFDREAWCRLRKDEAEMDDWFIKYYNGH